MFVRIAIISCIMLLGKNNFAQSKVNKEHAKANQLFNGRDLDGWYTFLKDKGRDSDLKKVFTVKRGQIRISGEEWGCITTHAEFENYRLIVEFRWGAQTFEPRKDKARDSGVLLHSMGKDGGYSGTWIHGIECQIIEGGTGDFLVVGDGSETYSLTAKVAPEKVSGAYVYQPDGQPVTILGGRINWYGRDTNWTDQLGFRGKRDVENQIGEWNTMECVAEGEKITIFLNGILVNESFNVMPSKGKIQIQSEGAELFIRKVELYPISH